MAVGFGLLIKEIIWLVDQWMRKLRKTDCHLIGIRHVSRDEIGRDVTDVDSHN